MTKMREARDNEKRNREFERERERENTLSHIMSKQLKSDATIDKLPFHSLYSQILIATLKAIYTNQLTH